MTATRIVLQAGVAFMGAAALLLSGCGPKALALPANPVDKAATCGIVEAAMARKTGDAAKGDLPFDEQGRILHYALLAASEGGSFSRDVVAKVVDRMSALQDNVTKGDFEKLVVPCHQAYPAAARATPEPLPADAFTARLGCYELGSFLNHALPGQNPEYGERLSEYGSLRRRLDVPVGASLSQRGAKSTEAQDKLRARALATMVGLGAPMAVMNQCLAKYPDPQKKAAA